MPSCVYILGDVFRFKAQLWSFCDFPKPAFLSDWQNADSTEFTFSHTLSETPIFAISQVWYPPKKVSAQKYTIYKVSKIDNIRKQFSTLLCKPENPPPPLLSLYEFIYLLITIYKIFQLLFLS